MAEGQAAGIAAASEAAVSGVVVPVQAAPPTAGTPRTFLWIHRRARPTRQREETKEAWARHPRESILHDRHDARDPLESYLGAMTNAFGVVLDSASLRRATIEGVSETVIAAIYFLHERSVDEIVAKLRPSELEQVIKLVGRCPSCYPPGTLAALKDRRRLPSPKPQPAASPPKAPRRVREGRWWFLVSHGWHSSSGSLAMLAERDGERSLG